MTSSQLGKSLVRAARIALQKIFSLCDDVALKKITASLSLTVCNDI